MEDINQEIEFQLFVETYQLIEQFIYIKIKMNNVRTRFATNFNSVGFARKKAQTI